MNDMPWKYTGDPLEYHFPEPTPAQLRWEREHVIPHVVKPEFRTLYGWSLEHVAEVFGEETAARGMDAAALARAAGIPQGDAEALLSRGLAPMASVDKAARLLKIRVVAVPRELAGYGHGHAGQERADGRAR